MKRFLFAAVRSLVVCLIASPAFATFHEMKIEQVIGGVAGDTNQQAIQLRMRLAGQNMVGTNQARLIARDAAGANPVTLIVFPTDVTNFAQGARILVVSSAFAAAQPTIAGDFTMTNTIPASYLAAGRLTFENNAGTILWSLAWGGGAYTGSNTGSTTNDADGNFGPPFASALPSTTGQALRFTTADATGAAPSTNNAADYGVTAGSATFTNNAGASGTVALPQADLSVTKTAIPDPVAPSQPVTYTITVTNAGPATATSVLVSDTLPPGTVFTSASGTGWTCGVAPGIIVTCNRATLAVGTAPIITLVIGAPATPGPITNNVTVSSVAVNDSNSANNTATAVTQVSGIPGQADLSITKSDGGLEGRFGYPLAYTITVTNAGPASVAGATVTDNFPAGLSGATWTCSATGGSSCPASGTGNIAAPVSLLSGGSATFLATATVVAGTASPVLNTATVAAPGGVVDPTPGNNSSTESTVVGPIAFHTVDPCRLVDTRDPAGPAGGPPLAANAARTFSVTGHCGIPADARAVAINLAVVVPTDFGNLRIYPAGGAPPLASVVNFGPAAVRANNAIIGLGTGGAITVQCDMPPGSSGVTNFLMDVTAYFR
jgi:uncharacterized repeat protein (TIGR01451 family)